VKTYYGEDETHQTAFGGIVSGIEECRAEATSLYLAFKDEVLEMYGIAPELRARDEISSALTMLHAGLKTLTCYAPEVNQWKQAHARARFAIVRAAILWGRGSVSVRPADGT